MVEEVGEQNYVVRSGEVDVEGGAGEHVVAVLNAGLFGIFEGDAKDGSPVEAGDVGVGVLLCDLDAEEAVASGDVEDMDRASAAIEDDFAEWGGHGAHHGSHVVGKLDP